MAPLRAGTARRRASSLANLSCAAGTHAGTSAAAGALPRLPGPTTPPFVLRAMATMAQKRRWARRGAQAHRQRRTLRRNVARAQIWTTPRRCSLTKIAMTLTTQRVRAGVATALRRGTGRATSLRER